MMSESESNTPLLEMRNVHKTFALRTGLAGKRASLQAVTDVNLTVVRGECLALVGESGCGKSTLGRLVLQLLRPTSGSVHFDGVEVGAMGDRSDRLVRGRIQVVFQDPYSSMNPRMRVRDIVAEPLQHAKLPAADLQKRVLVAIEDVGLQEEHLERYPHEFSGGQRQRIGIARALVGRPDLLVCDEAVSALDVSVQAQILNLLQSIREKYALTIIFISHNLAAVRHIADRVAVMYLGELVELADNEHIFTHPRHPYTRALLEAVLDPEHTGERRGRILSGEIPSPVNPPAGCYFSTRCPIAIGRCSRDKPQFDFVTAEHVVRCLLAGEEESMHSAPLEKLE